MSELQGPPSAEAAAEPVQDDTFTVLDLVLVLVRRRRLIVATTGIAAVVLLAYNILAMVIDPESRWNLLPTWFTASVTVSIADDGPDYGAGAATLLSRIPDTGGLADFASLLAPGTSTDASRAQELLIGREILDALARQQGFVTDASGNDDIVLARERLGENLDTEYLFESDLLVISYDHYYPDQAAAGLEFAVQRLREKMHALTIERVRRRKIFLDERLAEVRQDRTEAQDALTEFQQEFGVINLAAQSESAIENVTALKTELYRKEVELHSQIELLGENTAAVVRLRSAVDKLRTLIREIEHGFVEFQDSAIPLQELPALGVRYLDLATELRLDRSVPVVRPARPVSEPPVETNAAEVGLAVCRYLSTLATSGYLSGCWMRSMSKSTSRSGQWKCPSRSSITLKTWSTEACRNHGNRSWSRYNSVSRHASHRPTGVSCTTSTREVLTPCTYYLLLSSLDDLLDRSRLVGADAFRHCGFDCRVEPEFRLEWSALQETERPQREPIPPCHAKCRACR